MPTALVTTTAARDALDRAPRLGLVDAPSPVTSLDGLAAELGLGGLHVKRDDLLPALFGGTKVRKLDLLLATPPWRDAPRWASTGAIGSGHLVALVAAAARLDRAVDATVFWEPPTPRVLEGLAYTASGAARLAYVPTRVSLALRRPRLLLGGTLDGAAVVPVGATTPDSALALVQAGLELADQVRAGLLPAPDDVVVPLGTQGIAAGLAVGLCLGGLRPRVHAVAVAEPWFTPRWRLDRLIAATCARLGGVGAPLPEVVVHRGQVGPGYGVPSVAGEAAVARLAAHGVPLEGVYGGKAMAALLDAAPSWRGRQVLFWSTCHRSGLPARDDWPDLLPAPLRARLDGARRGPSRRALLAGAGVAAAAAALGVRVGGYTALPDHAGHVLAAWEAVVVAAAVEAIVPDVPGPLPAGGPSAREVAANVDRYLVGMSDTSLREIHGLVALVEHGTALGGHVARFTRLDPAARRAFLDGLAARGGLLRAAARGLRDLCMLGYWQDPRTWPAIGYGGPLVARVPGVRGRYDDLVAAPGVAP